MATTTADAPAHASVVSFADPPDPIRDALLATRRNIAAAPCRGAGMVAPVLAAEALGAVATQRHEYLCAELARLAAQWGNRSQADARLLERPPGPAIGGSPMPRIDAKSVAATFAALRDDPQAVADEFARELRGVAECETQARVELEEAHDRFARLVSAICDIRHVANLERMAVRKGHAVHTQDYATYVLQSHKRMSAALCSDHTAMLARCAIMAGGEHTEQWAYKLGSGVAALASARSQRPAPVVPRYKRMRYGL